MTPTQQQTDCVTLCANNNLIKVGAIAGSGKTSTLVMIANSLVQPSLYMAFNKAIATEAANKFPKHVMCRTTHSLAYQDFGLPLVHKLTRPKGHYVNVAGTGSEIAKHFHLEASTGATANAIGMFIKRTVERFEQSGDITLKVKHLPTYDMAKAIVEDSEISGYVLKFAKKLWTERCNLSSKVLASHDTYLKLWQLSKPVLPYEIIYLDEAQDTNPCMLDIVKSQPKTTKIVLVGDKHQAIYGFRGAINAMASVQGKEAHLSKSFRYGQKIANVASAILNNETMIEGNGTDSLVGHGVVDRSKPYMYLFRTNALLLIEAVAAIDKGESVKIEIDVNDFLKVLTSAMALSAGDMKNVKHERVLPYSDWSTMKEEAKEEGGEVKYLVGLIEKGGAARVVRVLESYVAPKNAHTVYTTAHKSKGREHTQVVLADDFPTNFVKGQWKGLAEAETNLLYVAATRSRMVLEINQSVKEILQKYNVTY